MLFPSCESSAVTDSDDLLKVIYAVDHAYSVSTDLCNSSLRSLMQIGVFKLKQRFPQTRGPINEMLL